MKKFLFVLLQGIIQCWALHIFIWSNNTEQIAVSLSTWLSFAVLLEIFIYLMFWRFEQMPLPANNVCVIKNKEERMFSRLIL